MILAPAVAPCRSCPYRRDVPSGIWHAEEYAKLPPYDRETGFQPTSVFLCHQQDGRACAGWVGVHDMDESLGLRVAVLRGMVEDADVFLDYTTATPLFASGTEAAAHGMRDLLDPGPQAQTAMTRITKKHAKRV